MTRDPELLRRLYGERTRGADPRLPGASAVLPAAWLIGLVLLGGGATVLALGVLALGISAGSGPLGEWGVIDERDAALFVHDHSARSDGSDGCVVTQDRLIRWEDRRRVAEVALAGSRVVVDEVGVHATDPAGRSVDCPFAPGEDPWPFAGTATRVARRGATSP